MKRALIRHLSLVLMTSVVFVCIHQVTLFLYFNHPLNPWQAFFALWASPDWYFKGLAILNYLIKPILFYVFSWILWLALEMARQKR